MSPLSFAYHLDNDTSANPFKKRDFLVNKSDHNTALLMTISMLLVLKVHNVDNLSNDVRLRAIGMLEAGMRQAQVARRLGVSQCDQPLANSVCPKQQHNRPMSKWAPEVYVASPGSVPAHTSLELTTCKWRTSARTFLKNWNKSVCPNCAESTSQR